MKKLVLMAAMAFSFCAFAQENDDNSKNENLRQSLQLTTVASAQSLLGVTFESKIDKNSESLSFITVGLNGMDYDTGFADVTGYGWYAGIGKTTFLGKYKDKFRGLYFANSIGYGSIKFDDNSSYTPFGIVKFKGKYRYLTLFNPELGWRFYIGDHFHIVPSVGAMWKIEIKGKGDVDNKNVDEWSGRIGVKFGWTF